MPFVFLLSLDQISEQAFPAPFKYTYHTGRFSL
jgi:hypothetical protein